jgi:hypothetical protein
MNANLFFGYASRIDWKSPQRPVPATPETGSKPSGNGPSTGDVFSIDQISFHCCWRHEGVYFVARFGPESSIIVTSTHENERWTWTKL